MRRTERSGPVTRRLSNDDLALLDFDKQRRRRSNESRSNKSKDDIELSSTTTDLIVDFPSTSLIVDFPSRRSSFCKAVRFSHKTEALVRAVRVHFSHKTEVRFIERPAKSDANNFWYSTEDIEAMRTADEHMQSINDTHNKLSLDRRRMLTREWIDSLME